MRFVPGRSADEMKRLAGDFWQLGCLNGS